MPKGLSMTDRVTEQLRYDITNGVYNSEYLITEYETSEKFGVSKTPAREALSQLCAEGLLEKIPRKGYFLKHYSPQDLKNILNFRYVLEMYGLELVCEQASDKELDDLLDLCDRVNDSESPNQYVDLNYQFHIALISLGRNPFLTNALANALDQMKLALTLSLDYTSSYDVIRITDHAEIVRALKERDLEKAKKLSGRFVENITRRMADTYFSAE